MAPPLVTAVLAVALTLALWATVAGGLDRQPGGTYLKAMFGMQALLVAQLAYVLFRISGGDRPASTGTFAGYLVLSLLLLPGGFVLAVEERSRYGTLVLAVALLAVAVVELRLDATWS